MATSLELLANLTAAIADAHTRRELVRGACAGLRGLDLLRVELGACEGVTDRAQTVIGEPTAGGLVLREASRELAGSAIAAALASEEPRMARVSTGRAGPPDEREAAAAGSRSSLILPLSREAYALVWLGRQPRVLDAATRGLLAGLLGAAWRGVRLIERLAGISRRAHRESSSLRDRLRRLEPERAIVARSEAMRQVLERVDAVAGYDTTVLIQGESGTGKELLARRIHQRSARAAGPLVMVNCGALPPGLVESELFGHEKGAFTGAAARHRGRFERASGGTILLDEVGELPLPAQVKLLRVLQERELERVGGEETIAADVRVVAATHQPLEELTLEGRFRADLYYRLSVFPIAVPPLRERADDLAPLVHTLLGELAQRLGRPEPRVSRASMARLARHTWPGNVRELANALEAGLILSRGPELELPESGGGPAATERPSAPSPLRPLEEVVRDAIEDALRACGGRIYGDGGAARALGLKPSTLQSKMRRLGIRRVRAACPTSERQTTNRG